MSLLATCYFRSGDISHAYALLSKCIGASQLRLHTPKARFLLAKCCYLLEKFSEAEDALIGRIVTFGSGGANNTNNTNTTINQSNQQSGQIGNTSLLSTTGNILASTPAPNVSTIASSTTGHILDPTNNPDLLAGFGELESFAYELLANVCM